MESKGKNTEWAYFPNLWFPELSYEALNHQKRNFKANESQLLRNNAEKPTHETCSKKKIHISEKDLVFIMSLNDFTNNYWWKSEIVCKYL